MALALSGVRQCALHKPFCYNVAKGHKLQWGRRRSGAEGHMGAPVTIMISREEIVSEDVSRVRTILNTFVPTLVERNRNRVTIMVEGYNDDPRELFLINEVRKWFHHLFDAVPELFFG